MRVITSGSRYLDIDAYAACIGYAELLRLEGTKAQAISTAPLNGSISPKLRIWKPRFTNKYISSPDDSFTLIDVSDPDHFDELVDLERIDEVIDHHPGFESYWAAHSGVQAQIESIGAACTQVYGRWHESGFLPRIKPTTARLMICGILDNTLNFGARITTLRDKNAYRELLMHADLPTDWPDLYFKDCQQAMLRNLPKAVTDDSKILKFKSYPGEVCAGQLVLWDGQKIANSKAKTVAQVLSEMRPDWFMNVISLNDHCSYFLSQNPQTKAWLSQLLDVTFDDNIARSDRMWLRKEIIKRDIDEVTAPHA
jgi:inorganic pyrophosphatase/exopolyphosphatase